MVECHLRQEPRISPLYQVRSGSIAHLSGTIVAYSPTPDRTHAALHTRNHTHESSVSRSPLPRCTPHSITPCRILGRTTFGVPIRLAIAVPSPFFRSYHARSCRTAVFSIHFLSICICTSRVLGFILSLPTHVLLHCATTVNDNALFKYYCY